MTVAAVILAATTESALADADGTVVRRLDFIFAEEEMREALDLVAG